MAIQCPTNPYLNLATHKNKKFWVLASRIKGEGDGEVLLSDFWDYICDLAVKTAFWRSNIVRQAEEKRAKEEKEVVGVEKEREEEELPSLDHLLTWGASASPTSRLTLIKNLYVLQAMILGELSDK